MLSAEWETDLKTDQCNLVRETESRLAATHILLICSLTGVLLSSTSRFIQKTSEHRLCASYDAGHCGNRAKHQT